MPKTWKEIWEARRVDSTSGSVLARLMSAGGFDTPFAAASDEAWLQHVSRTAAAIGIVPGCSVFDVGCGAGAYLFDLHQRGCSVAGLDGSSTLIRLAAEAMPLGTWIHADAAELDDRERYDFVVASGSFHCFPSLEYAQAVIERMARKARRGVMLLDLPDLAKREDAIASRSRLVGGEAYARKYDGLDHLYFDRTWVRTALSNAGVSRIEIEDQQIEGYPNAAHRYNVFGWLASEVKTAGS